jgi:hypothetical protein
MKIWRKVPCYLELYSHVCESLTHHNEQEARMVIAFMFILQAKTLCSTVYVTFPQWTHNRELLKSILNLKLGM